MMKNQLIYTIFAAGTVLGLASCNNDVVSSLLHDENDRISFTAATDNDDIATTRGLTEMSQGVSFRDTQAGRPLMLSATVTGRAQTTTRGHRFGDEAEDELTAFRVSAIQADANISGEDFAEATPNLFYNLKAQKNAGDVFEIAQDYYWPVSSDKLWFYAYTPCDDANVVVSSQTTGGAQKITFTVDPVVTNQVDLMTADAVTTGFNDVSGTQKKASVPLTFRHELTAIRFVIGEQWLAGSIKSVAIKGVHGKGTLTIGDGSHWVWKDATGTDISTLDDFTLTLDKTGVEGTGGEEFMDGDFSKQYFLMIPQSFDDNDDAVIEVVYQDARQDYTVTAPLKGQDAWQRNTTVTYAISSHTLTTLKIGTIQWPDNEQWNAVKSGFADGDKVGLYVVAEDNTDIVYKNVPCTLNGTTWSINHETTQGVVYHLPGYQYFFYYPYTETPDQRYPLQGQGEGNSTAPEDFFSSVVIGWEIPNDQHLETTINAYDLQIAKGVDDVGYSSMVNASMAHTMGMVKLTPKNKTIPVMTYVEGTTNYMWKSSSKIVNPSTTFQTYIPYGSGPYYYIENPRNTSSIQFVATGDDYWSQIGDFAVNTVNNYDIQSSRTYELGTKYTPSVGDVFFSDGSIASATSNYNGKTPVGIVFATSTANTDAEVAGGYTHGYVLALKTANNHDVTQFASVYCTNGQTLKHDALRDDMKGLDYTKIFIDTYGNNALACNYAVNYKNTAPITKTDPLASGNSNWFLPSLGQVLTLYYNIGGLTKAGINYQDDSCFNWNSSTMIGNNINAALANVSAKGYSVTNWATTATNDNYVLWTSSQSGDDWICYVSVTNMDQGTNNSSGHSADYQYRVRSILAF